VTATVIRTSQVAIVGRVADELTRSDLNSRGYSASLRNHRRQAVQKEDGYFVFADLPASPPDYQVELAGRQFQTRRLDVTATGTSAVEIEEDGEDELQVIVTDIDVALKRVSFATLPFTPSIAKNADVFGEGGVSTTLGESLEGVDADGAVLSSVTGISIDDALRIVRSTRLLLRPGPYYPFPESTTVAAIRVVDSLSGEEPIADAMLEISAVNGAAVAPVLVDGVTLFRAELPPTPTTPFMIGTLQALGTFTNARGQAVFYYAPATPVTSLAVSVTKAGYVPQTATVAVTAGARTSSVVQLVRS
jgi:hypothetical protein